MKYKLQLLSCFLLLLSTHTAWAQDKKCSHKNFWLKADYKNLKHAEQEKNRYAAIIKSKDAHDTVYAKAFNTTGLYYDFAGQQDSALFYFKKAVRYLKKYPEKQIAPLINIATQFNIMGSFDTSIKWSKKALALNKKHGNDILKAHIYHSMAASYLYKGDIEKATANVLLGIRILERLDDQCYIGLFKVTLAGTYLQSNNYKFAADLLEEYLNQNKNDKENKVYAIATINYTETLIALGQKDKAYNLLTDIVKYVEQAGDKELEAVLYAKIATIEDLRGNTARALVYFERAYILLSEKKSKYSMLIFSNYISVLNEAKQYQKAIKIINDFRHSPAYVKSYTHERFEYERAIAEIYEETGNWPESSSSYKRAMMLSDTLRMLENGRNTNALQAEFQTEFQRENNMKLASHNQSLQKKVQTEQRLMLMYILSSIAIIIIISMFLRAYLLRNKLQKEELKVIENKKNHLEKQHVLEQELTNSQQQVIEEKQREATSMALQMANYYDNLNSLLEKVNDNTFTKLSDVKKELQHLTKQKDYWREFEIRFNNANPNFESRLMAAYPVLTKNDIQFCSLLKLNLSYKEIASLLQISYESAVTKKYRIKKKLDINDDTEFEKLLSDF